METNIKSISRLKSGWKQQFEGKCDRSAISFLNIFKINQECNRPIIPNPTTSRLHTTRTRNQEIFDPQTFKPQRVIIIII
jgi:hypothetical protein